MGIMDTEKIYEGLGISREVWEYGQRTESRLKERFEEFDKNAEYNQMKVIRAMQENRVSEGCFNYVSGYGYNDLGRDTLESVYASVFHTEAALVRPQITCGTHALALALAANRRIHKAYVRVRENDFSLGGMQGVNFYKKTAGIVGTGKIGAAMARICHGFGMNVIAYDKYQNPALDFVTYVSLDELLAQSDLISLHCPLMDETYHMINRESIQKMKDGVILVNTSRGGLVKTADLIEGIRARKFFAVGLDVYEEEKRNVFEDRSDEIMETSITARLLSFPNVIITSHQGFFTYEALDAISETTLNNAMAFTKGERTGNEVEVE